MNIVAIATDSNFNRSLLHRIHQHCPLRCVVRPQWESSPSGKSRWQRLRKAPLQSIARSITDRWDGFRSRRLDRQIGQFLFQDVPPPPLDVEEISIPSWRFNSPATADLLRSLEPDLILMSAAPILKRDIFATPRLGCVNVHRGIAPEYRGEWTLFWALYRRDYEHLGVTIHSVDDGVDTGPVLVQGYPDLTAADTEATIMAKCARLASDLLLDILDDASNAPLAGTVAPPLGRNFRNRDRTALHDAIFWLRRTIIGERCPTRAFKVAWNIARRN
jgi:methionyl-tRNA formyltransferase